MGYNIVDAYYDRIKNNITGYATILVKYAFNKKDINKKLYSNIINHYIDDVNWNQLKISEDIDSFINNNGINHVRLNNIVNYTILYMNKENLRYNFEENAELVISVAKMLLIAIAIHTKTDILINTNSRCTHVLNDILRENSSLYDDQLKAKIRNADKDLKEKIKENISVDRKFIAKTKNNNFYLTFSSINDELAMVKFNYEIKMLNKYLKTDIEHQIMKKELNNKFTIIESEMLSLLIMKWNFSRKDKKIFFLDIPKGFISHEELIDDLIDKLSNKQILQHICLSIDYNDLLENKEIISNLRNHYFKIAVKNVEKINEHKEKNTFSNLVDYLFGNEILKANNEYPREFCRDTNVKYIDEENCKAKYISEDRFMFS